MPLFTVVYFPKYFPMARFTVVISNKQVKVAPKRARIKRRVRAMIRKVFFTDTSDFLYDCIFLAKDKILSADWQTIVAQGEKVLFDITHSISPKTD